jgi:hypothetical protein
MPFWKENVGKKNGDGEEGSYSRLISVISTEERSSLLFQPV